jgi:hypothetical protein
LVIAGDAGCFGVAVEDDTVHGEVDNQKRKMGVQIGQQ